MARAGSPRGTTVARSCVRRHGRLGHDRGCGRRDPTAVPAGDHARPLPACRGRGPRAGVAVGGLLPRGRRCVGGHRPRRVAATGGRARAASGAAAQRGGHGDGDRRARPHARRPLPSGRGPRRAGVDGAGRRPGIVAPDLDAGVPRRAARVAGRRDRHDGRRVRPADGRGTRLAAARADPHPHGSSGPEVPRPRRRGSRRSRDHGGHLARCAAVGPWYPVQEGRERAGRQDPFDVVVYLRAYRGPDAQEKLRRDGKHETGNYGVVLSAAAVDQAVADLAGAGATTVVLVAAGDEPSVADYLDEVAGIVHGLPDGPRRS